MGDDARLAGAGPGEDEQRPFDRRHGLALRRVQVLQDVVSGYHSGTALYRSAAGEKVQRCLFLGRLLDVDAAAPAPALDLLFDHAIFGLVSPTAAR